MFNNRGSVKVLLLLVIALIVGFIVVKRRNLSEPQQFQSQQVKQKVIRLKPVCGEFGCIGGYAYQSASNQWFYYHIPLSQPESALYVSYVNSRSSLPDGGSWSAQSAAPKAEDIEMEQEIEVAQNEQGEPIQASQGIVEARGVGGVGEASEGSAAGLEQNKAEHTGSESPQSDSVSVHSASPDSGSDSAGAQPGDAGTPAAIGADDSASGSATGEASGTAN